MFLYFRFQAKSSVFESVGYDGGHRNSLIPVVSFEVLPFICYYIRKQEKETEHEEFCNLCDHISL